MCIHEARFEYRHAKFASDWALGLCIFADAEFSLSVTQPVEYEALETSLAGYERAEREAFEELEWHEEQVDRVTGTVR